MAAAADTAGASRIFVMGYDYRVSDSTPGASAPLVRGDGGERDLTWTLDLYAALGVPVQRTILGLPLYGMSWPVDSPELDAIATGKGDTWIPAHNLATLTDPTLASVTDPLEAVERLALETADGWQAVYYDSPGTLARKLALADERGLAGAGFWALGYERGLPGYTELIATFGAGRLLP
jgi:spore germination protein YaaH